LIAIDFMGVGAMRTSFTLKGDQWQVLQSMSTISTYTWDTIGSLGQHRVRVRVMNTGTDDQPVNRGRNITL